MKNNIKHESTKGLVRLLESILEIAILSVIYYVVWRYAYSEPNLFASKGKYVLMGVYAAIMFFLFENMDGFKFGELRRLDLSLAQWIASFIANFVTYFQLCLIENRLLSPIPMIILAMVNVVVCTALVFIYTFAYQHRRPLKHTFL